MKRKTRNRILGIDLYILISLSVIGSLAGTLAWYDYVTRAGIHFHGTAVKGASLQIGIFADDGFVNEEEYQLEEDPDVEGLYWAKNDISSDALLAISEFNGYGGKKLSPVTSGSYSSGSILSLKACPFQLENNLNRVAEKKLYNYMQFAFRPLTDEGNVDLEHTYGIRIADFEVTSSASAEDSLRLLVTGSEKEALIAPHIDESSYDLVGGPLDLNLDGYLDADSRGREFLYGEADNLVYQTTPSQGEPLLPIGERTTFNGVTQKGVYAIDREASTFAKAEYVGKNDIVKGDVFSHFDPTVGYAAVDMTVFLEGWNLSCNDHAQNSFFNLDIDFELVFES